MRLLPQSITREIRQTVLFDKNDIEVLIATRARELCDMKMANYKIIIEEQTEGSPPYKVGYKARVELTVSFIEKGPYSP